MSTSRAILTALMAYFLWVVSDTIVKIGGQESMSPFVIVGAFGVVASLGLFLQAWIKGNVKALRPTRYREQTGIMLCALFINFANVFALKHLALTTFYAIVFTIPLMIAAMSAFLKHESLSSIKIICLIFGFLGAVLAIGIPDGQGDWIGYVAGFISVVSFSMSAILMRKLAKTATVESIQFYKSVPMAVMGVLGALVEAKPLPSMALLGFMLLSGVLSATGAVLYNKALHNTVSTNVAQFHYTQIIFGAIFGYILWHEVPTWNLIVGAGIIMAAGLVVAMQARKKDLQNA